MKSVEMTRFDTRLTKEQKEFFEYASKLGGFIIASKRDQEIFFNFVFKGEKPNKELKSALKEYNSLL